MNSSPLSPLSSADIFSPSPIRMSSKLSAPGSSQIFLSSDKLSVLVNRAVSEALATQEIKRYHSSFPKLPKLKSLPTVWLTALDIGKAFVPKPPYFNGDKKQFLGWWRQLILHLSSYQETPNDMQKIMIALSLMKGRSAEYFTNMFTDAYNLETYSFEEFKWNLSMTFQLADICRKAEQELASLRQKSGELIEEFIL